MAITKIRSIKATPEKAIDYITKNKTEKIITAENIELQIENAENIIITPGDVSRVINYVVADKKNDSNTERKNDETDNEERVVVFKTVSKAFNCSLKNAAKEWETVRKHFGKNNKILSFHVIQNFGLKLDASTAHEIGCRLAEEIFGNFQAVVSTHINTENTHNHIVFNSVSFLDGKKYYSNHETYRKLRRASDKLCDEYGIEVIENTRDCVLIKYEDGNGKIRFFEPTERKEKLREGKFANANDYRDTKAYSKKQKDKNQFISIIRNDIDELIITVKSYDELLNALRKRGYKINSRKANGDWLKYVSFAPPGQKRPTRDCTLGENYTRERLTELIEEREKTPKVNAELEIEHVAENKNLSEDKSYLRESIDNGVEENEDTVYASEDILPGIKSVISDDVKRLNREVEAEYRAVFKKPPETPELALPKLKSKRSRYLRDQIMENVRALEFIDRTGIATEEQLSVGISSLKEKRQLVKTELEKISGSMKKAHELVAAIEKMNELEQKIVLGLADDYDQTLYQKYGDFFVRNNLGDDSSRRKFVDEYGRFKNSFGLIANTIREIDAKIAEHEHCGKVLARINRNVERYSINAPKPSR